MIELQTVWTWQPALYLFLGGMGAGAFVMAGVLFYRFRQGNERVISLSAWASVLCLAVGLLLLLTELTNPARGMMLWQSFSHFTSWMTIGAWLLFAAVIVMGLVAIGSTPALVRLVLKERMARANQLSLDTVWFKILMPIGMVLGLGVAVYTGILLLSAPGIPFWNTLLLPCLFTVSALDTGVALVEVIGVFSERTAREGGVPSAAPSRSAVNKSASHQMMNRVVVVLVALELVVLACLIASSMMGFAGSAESATAALSARALTAGVLAAPFWILVVALGLVLPLAVAMLGAGKKALPSGATIAGAVGAMIGGCALRFLILAVGIHSDVVGSSVLNMFM